eukprot:11862941-Ditylum_brightwellii.AAC.1
MADALLCSSSHHASIMYQDGRVGHKRGRNTCDDDCVVKMLLKYDDLDGEEGEILVLPPKSRKEQEGGTDAGFIGGLTLNMLLSNLEQQDNDRDSNYSRSCYQHHHHHHSSSNSETTEANKKVIENCAVEEAFSLWWEHVSNQIKRFLERNASNSPMNEPVPKSLDANNPD